MKPRPLLIGTVAAHIGVRPEAIRYYERRGLLPSPGRAPNGYRIYSSQHLERVEFIKKAQSLGLRLTDIKEILDLADRGRCPCGHVQRVLKIRLAELRRKIADLRLLEGRIRQAVQGSCPPNFRPRGKAICPTIERQAVQARSVRS